MKVQKLKGRASNLLLVAVSLLFFSSPIHAYVSYEQRDDVKAFIDEMVNEHKFDRADLENKFAKAKKLENVLDSIARPAEKRLVWRQYRPIFVTNTRSNRGKSFMKEHLATLERAEKEYGVPKEIITAIIGVETYYGRQTGGYTVFDSLTTLGFDYPPRSKFFKSELKEFLLLSREEHISVDDMTGSYAGAMGMPQFISSSYRKYAVDFDGDGKRDLWNSTDDVIGSVANYFKEHGWQPGESITFPVSVSDVGAVWEENTLKPNVTVRELKEKGVTLDYKDDTHASDSKLNASSENTSTSDKPFDDQLVTLLKYEGKRGDEYWIGLKNFYVITRYNHNEMYAMAVYQLSEKLKN